MVSRPCHVRSSPQSGHSPELEHGFIFIGASMTVLPSIMQAIVQRAPEVEIKTEERDTTKMVRITDALNCTYTGRCARDRLLRGSGVCHGHGQDYRHDSAACGKNERQQLHERFPRREVSAVISNVR
jgi:hypothetical protein